MMTASEDQVFAELLSIEGEMTVSGAMQECRQGVENISTNRCRQMTPGEGRLPYLSYSILTSIVVVALTEPLVPVTVTVYSPAVVPPSEF